MIALHTISIFVGDDTVINADNGTLDIEIGGEYPNDAQLQIFSRDRKLGERDAYRTLARFFRSCAQECEAVLADLEDELAAIPEGILWPEDFTEDGEIITRGHKEN